MASDMGMRPMERTAVQLLATVSHEFRNALTPLKGYLLNLTARAPDPSDGARSEAYGAMLRQSERLERLATDLLEASTIRSGRLGVVATTFDVADLVRRHVDDAAPGHARRVEVRAPRSAAVRGDPARSHQVLANLLSNAGRAAPAGTAVRVTVAIVPGRAIVSVRDEGDGISLEHQGDLFGRFLPLPGGTNATGIGLGLFVARSLIEAMGGRIWVVSRPGRGTTVSFSLVSEGEDRRVPK
jgi:two-component system, OmpR family, sensor kinase